MNPCPNCHTENYTWRASCGVCGVSLKGGTAQIPSTASSLPVVLKATPTEVDDLPPVGVAYTARVAVVEGVAARDWDRGYLERWRADMVAQEDRAGLGVDTLHCQYPYIYGKGRIARSLRGSRWYA